MIMNSLNYELSLFRTVRYGVFFSVLFYVANIAFSQYTFTGCFSTLCNQSVRLVGFHGLDIYTIDSVKASANGAFSLSF
jgi:hypothetical protein